MRKPKPEANTFLTHLSSRGLADERYEVRRYKSTGGGELRPLPARESAGRRSKRVTASRRAVREMRPARDELIVCTGIKIPGSGLQLWGEHLVGEKCCAGECSRPAPGGRPAGPAPAARIPSTPGRETACPTRTRLFDARENANATGGGRPSAARRACAPGAANTLPRPGEASARTASREDASPNKPDTPEPNQRVLDMAGGIPRAAGAWRARGPESAGASVSKPGSARLAVNENPPRAARSAGFAGRNAARRKRGSMKKDAPGTFAVVAEAP